MDKLIKNLTKLNWHTIDLVKNVLLDPNYKKMDVLELINKILDFEIDFIEQRKKH